MWVISTGSRASRPMRRISSYDVALVAHVRDIEPAGCGCQPGKLDHFLGGGKMTLLVFEA